MLGDTEAVVHRYGVQSTVYYALYIGLCSKDWAEVEEGESMTGYYDLDTTLGREAVLEVEVCRHCSELCSVLH